MDFPAETGTFFATKTLPCPYLKGQDERKLFTKLPADGAEKWANALSRAGFRRTHHLCYIPACPACSACISVRVDVKKLRLDRTQRKIMRRNADLSVSWRPNVATEEQYALFSRYLAARHAGSEMNDMGQEEYRSMIEDSPVPGMLMEVRAAATDALKAVMLIDETDDGLSAVYSFFDPEEQKRSLGVFMITTVCNRLILLNKPYLYLGYFIAGCSNMAYKSRFRPLEMFRKGKWVSFADQMENDVPDVRL